ncbi:apoptosis-enhancing nuclease isoform X4 [Pteropus medius]|uniref:apoptosis-enhancing nuclease isoform X4 n=1 Tax=Pteropus vampyrus TaxID=132908 RepID=UPI00196A1E9D|nr:apoptosis-enhancing nuclease isoform X4 [Pteropus giganteus]
MRVLRPRSPKWQLRLLPRWKITSQAFLSPSDEQIGMVPREAHEPAQCLCPLLASSNAKDVLRRKHKRKSRQHQRFMARKALLQGQGLLSTPPDPGSSPPPMSLEAPMLSEAPSGPQAASNGRQRPRAGPGGAPCSRKPTPRVCTGPLPSKCVAIDCEMVGTGPRGRVSELARCSVVSYHGDVLYDKYVRPEMPIVDYRTRWSGITRQHMRKAIPFQVAQKEVGQHGHSSVEDAMTAMELYRLVEVQWEQQEASSLWTHPDDKEPDSSTDVEQYMEDQYWPEDLAQGTNGGTGEAQDRRA